VPDYRVGYLLTYRVAAPSDGDAARKVMNAMEARFPAVKVELRSVQKSGSQVVSGSTTYDVQLIASGVVTAADIAASLTVVTPPAPNLVSSLLFASVDVRGEGLF